MNFLITGFRNKIISDTLINLGFIEKKSQSKDLDLLIYSDIKKSKKKIEIAKQNNIKTIQIDELPINYEYNIFNNTKINHIISNLTSNIKKIKINYLPYFINFIDLNNNTITIINKEKKIAEIYFIILCIPISSLKLKKNKEYKTNFASFEYNYNKYFYNYKYDNLKNDKKSIELFLTTNKPINIIKFDNYKISKQYYNTDMNSLSNSVGNMILFIKDNKYNIYDTISYKLNKKELTYNNKYNSKLPKYSDIIASNQITYRYYFYNYYFITKDIIYQYDISNYDKNKIVQKYKVEIIKDRMYNNYINLKDKINKMKKNKYKRQPLDEIYSFINNDDLFNYFIKVFNLTDYSKFNKVERVKIKDTIGYFNDAIYEL